jgi:hypothetical protein
MGESATSANSLLAMTVTTAQVPSPFGERGELFAHNVGSHECCKPILATIQTQKNQRPWWSSVTSASNKNQNDSGSCAMKSITESRSKTGLSAT